MTEQQENVTPISRLTPRELEIRRIVAEAPPLTATQRDEIRRIFAPVLDANYEQRKSA